VDFWELTMLATAKDLNLAGIEALILDLDGTLHNSGVPTSGAIEMVAWMRAKGVPFVFCTQDPDYGEAHVASRLKASGFDVREEDVVTGGATIVAELRRRYGDTPIELLCSDQQIAHLTARGLKAAAPGDDAPAILFGIYNGFSGADLERGCAAAWRGADLFVIAWDRSFRLPDGLIAGCGPFAKAVEHVTGRSSEALAKPSEAMARAALQRLGKQGAVTLVIGDTLDADIQLGKRIGARTVLALSGTTSLADLERLPAEERPDWAVKDVSVVFEALRARLL
jgi:HAD superfamily hydrolase (TIGR01450 family)